MGTTNGLAVVKQRRIFASAEIRSPDCPSIVSNYTDYVTTLILLADTKESENTDLRQLIIA